MAAYGIIDTWRKTSGFIAVPPWCNAAHGSLEPFVLVRVQVGELEMGPRGEAGTQIHLIHIHQRHDDARGPIAPCDLPSFSSGLRR